MESRMEGSFSGLLENLAFFVYSQAHTQTNKQKKKKKKNNLKHIILFFCPD